MGGNEGFVVRVADVADLAGIEEVQRAAGREVHTESVRAAILDAGRFVVVAVADPVTGTVTDPVTGSAGVVGWAKTHLYPEADGVAPAGQYLGGVTVAPELRRRGVGTALTVARLDWVAGRADRVHYLVNARNTASVALHRRWGFREVARAPSFHRVPFDGGVGLLLSADLARLTAS